MLRSDLATAIVCTAANCGGVVYNASILSSCRSRPRRGESEYSLRIARVAMVVAAVSSVIGAWMLYSRRPALAWQLGIGVWIVTAPLMLSVGHLGRPRFLLPKQFRDRAS